MNINLNKKNNSMIIREKWFIIFIAILTLSGGCKKKEVEQLPTAKVVKGTFLIDLFEEGEIEAVNSISIATPSISYRFGGNMKITKLVKDGQEVKAGDTLVVFDPTEVNKGITTAEETVEIGLAELEKMKAQHQSDLEELNASYQITKLSLEISKIQFEGAYYESEMKKKEIQLNLERAEINLVKAKEQIDNRIKIQKEEIKQKNLQIDQNRLMLNEGYESLRKLNLESPAPGIVIIRTNMMTGNKWQVGDQCWSNYPFIDLPDLSLLKATVKINEVDIAKITKGLEVQIRPDAFSDSVFTGRVNAVANLAVNKDHNSKIKIFPVEIILNETSKNMLPGMRVSCRIIIDKIEDVLFVPKDAVHLEGDKYFVYKKKGKSYEKIEVEVGVSNSDHIIIVEGLKQNDEIALGDPFIKETTNNKTGQ